MAKVLIVDDDRTVREMVTRSLDDPDVVVLSAVSAVDGIAQIRSEKPDVVLLDIMLPDKSGLDIFRDIRELNRKLPVVFITSSEDSGTAIRAMQLGAFDFVGKPLDLPALKELVHKAIESHRMMNTPVALPIGDADADDGDRFVGHSPEMLEVFKSIGRVAGEDIPVLIRGESGTGKELVARAIYQHSDRSTDCFMAINCAALSDTLLESELFGHEKGSFTGADKRRIGKFEQCTGGTIFLDEVGDMSQLTQGKILRLLQEQKFERVGGNDTIETDVRVITATNRNLESMVASGKFREDLLYRLNGMTVTLPPLRDRGDDIRLLVEHYLTLACREMNRDHIEGVSPEALELLQDYSWPGNVRELRSVMRQTLLNSTGPVVVPASLPPVVNAGTAAGRSARTPTQPVRENGMPPSDLAPIVGRLLDSESTEVYAEILEVMERYLITRVLDATNGNQTQAAERLGITRGKIRDRIAQFGISMKKTVSLESDG